MAGPTRQTMTIFGSSATTGQLKVFGSLANGTPTNATNVGTGASGVQSLSNWLTGWFSGVVGNFSPTIEDMNSAFWCITSQLAYLFERGIAEWDSGTTYNTNDYAKSNGVVYASLADSNTNNAVTNGSYWGIPLQNALLTNNAAVANTTVLTGTTLTVPNCTIGSSLTYTINSGGYLLGIGPMIVNGTLTISGTGRII